MADRDVMELEAENKRLRRERDELLLLVDSIGQDCIEALVGRDMEQLRRRRADKSDAVMAEIDRLGEAREAARRRRAGDGDGR